MTQTYIPIMAKTLKTDERNERSLFAGDVL